MKNYIGIKDLMRNDSMRGTTILSFSTGLLMVEKGRILSSPLLVMRE
jgi:hypothetical protein